MIFETILWWFLNRPAGRSEGFQLGLKKQKISNTSFQLCFLELLPLLVRGGVAYECIRRPNLNDLSFIVSFFPPSLHQLMMTLVYQSLFFSSVFCVLHCVPAVSQAVWCPKLKRQCMLKIRFVCQFLNLTLVWPPGQLFLLCYCISFILFNDKSSYSAECISQTVTPGSTAVHVKQSCVLGNIIF